MLENMPRIRFRSELGKPLVVSETGAGALSGLRAPEEELVTFSEDYQALVYRKQIEMLSQQESLAGVSPWILKDFRSPLRLHQGVQDYWNLKGLLAEDGTKKEASLYCAIGIGIDQAGLMQVELDWKFWSRIK